MKNYLNQNWVIGSFLENGFEAALSSETNVLSVWKRHFSVFVNSWVMKLKPFSGKARQSLQDQLNSKLVIVSFIGNGFEVTMSWKTNVLRVWNGHFSVFCNIWVRKLKPFSRKVRQNVQNYLNQNLVIGSFLENGFATTLSPKANVLSVLKRAFFNFLEIFEWRSWNRFLGKWDWAFKTK